MNRVVLLILQLSLIGFTLSTESSVPPSEDISAPEYYAYHHTIHNDLLNVDKELSTEHFDSAKAQHILEIKSRISTLLNELLKEEILLVSLKNSASKKKQDFFWFFHQPTRLAVDEDQIKVSESQTSKLKKINSQLRRVESILDSISLEWKKLKPLYGIYSKMFLFEALGFISEISSITSSFITTIMELGLLSLLLFGTVAGFLLSVLVTAGFSFFPVMLGYTVLAVCIYWILKLPFVMIEYSPSFPEFVSVYFAFVGMLVGFIYVTFRLLDPLISKPFRQTRQPL